MIREISFVFIIICGVGILIMSAIAVDSALALAVSIDAANCSEIVIDHTFIDQSSDGFLGTETHYFIVTKNRDLLELLPNKNVSAISDWHSLSNGSVISIRESGDMYVTCDYPRTLGILKGVL